MLKHKFPDIHIVSFATQDYKKFQNGMLASAKKFGFSKFFTYTEKDLIDTEFYRENKEIFNDKRGYGHWLWKPYFILKSIEKIPENEFVFYVDTGCKFLKDPNPLIEIARGLDSGIMSFDCFPLTNAQWTKRDTFINMGCDNEKFWNAPNVIATVALFRKTPKVVSFIEEWLINCLNKDSLIQYHNEENNLPDFVEHREDQSILSILIKKYNLETFRNPSRWGNFLKNITYREENEFVGTPYLFDTSINDYSLQPYTNSPYGTIFEFNRKNKKSKISDFRKKLLDKTSSVKRTLFPTKKDSYSINGEDLIISYLFERLAIENPSYIEIGANYFKGTSNTTLFYLKGCTGINIENDIVWFKHLQKIRKRDINLQLIVRSDLKHIDKSLTSPLNLNKKNEDGYSTLSKIIFDYRQNLFPNFLSINESTSPLDILDSINYTISYPKVISIQIKHFNSSARKIIDDKAVTTFLEEKGYQLYASTNVTLIFFHGSYKEIR